MSETRAKTTRAAPPGDVAAGGPRLGLALLVLAAAQLMVVLAATIVNVALPHIQRALGVEAGMGVGGGGVGLIGGGLVTTYGSWGWVLFVNVPIGAAVALAAPRVLAETPRRRGRFDLPGAITGTGGVAALVYGLISAATSPDGVSHWADAKVVASLTAAAALLPPFPALSTRSPNALLPVRL